MNIAIVGGAVFPTDTGIDLQIKINLQIFLYHPMLLFSVDRMLWIIL